ncbi:MAG: carboxypeptidase regulatory-like domain-containing protein, partial [bacterium]
MKRKTIKIILAGAFTCLCLLLLIGISVSQASNIIKAEYFIDQDPGEGKGIPLPSGDGNSGGEEEAVFLTDIPLASLQSGTHVVYIRMQNSDGQWGDPASTSLIITEDSAPTFKPETGQIVAAQYAIDILPADDSDNINTLNLTENQYTADALWQDIDITGLALGAHRLYARLKRADGAWGPFFCYPFIVIDEDASYGEYSISEAEYFIDQDPGVGNALPLLPLDGSFDQPQEDAFMDGIDISHLSLGNHVVYVRMKNNQGVWSLTRSFENQVSLTLGVMVTGTIRDAKTNLPLPGVTISFDERYFAVADSNGKYQISGLPLGVHEVIVNLEGYLPYRCTVDIQGLGLVNISLSHETTICGYVRDKATNQPIPNAQITFGGTTGFANQQGYYWITNIQEGTFTIMASAKGYKTSSRANVKVIENMATSDVNFLMEKGLDGEEDYPGLYDQKPPLEKTDENFIVKAGDPDGLKNNNVISKAQLTLMMYDLDPDEFDTIELNGYLGAAVVREKDANNLWKKVTVNIPLDKIKFPDMGTETSP